MSLNQLLHELKEKKDWDERQAISKKIIEFGDEAIAPLIALWKPFLTDEDYDFVDGKDANLHSIVEDTLLAIGTSAVDALIPLLTSEIWGERFGAIYCLHHLGDFSAIEPMIDSLETGDSNAMSEIADALESFGELSIVPLLGAIEHSNPKVRGEAAFCLWRFQRVEVKTALEALALTDSVPEVRISAMSSLCHFEDEDVNTILEQCLKDENEEVRELAQDYLDERLNPSSEDED